jgi:hypothetical protein
MVDRILILAHPEDNFPMAIVHTFTWKVKPGRRREFQGEIATVKTMVERLGGRVRVLDRQMGHNAPCILFFMESSDWKAFGDLQDRMQNDPELLASWSRAHVDNPNRPAEVADIALAFDLSTG